MKHSLRLYITGQTPPSVKAITDVRQAMQERGIEDHQLRIIDVLKEPQLAERDKIIATPTLVKDLPPPTRKLVGDLPAHLSQLLGSEPKKPK